VAWWKSRHLNGIMSKKQTLKIIEECIAQVTLKLSTINAVVTHKAKS